MEYAILGFKLNQHRKNTYLSRIIRQSVPRKNLSRLIQEQALGSHLKSANIWVPSLFITAIRHGTIQRLIHFFRPKIHTCCLITKSKSLFREYDSGKWLANSGSW